ncbi:MAG: ABC transporter ATP-binding protein [Pseudobutyrivibrio sp.]|uniref:ABC transporter ATP-binding protein n=1 Tax=Pseudobutyrivibrio sp. TaxID=2014367 RepID=UPI001B185287|nr:ABC transporter ATP-binding protein [Pseudobutyrivibrio sp.]MBO6284031.1 ABC transporter ATP-binding protein [Pseudobutyrivibrio sp.]MBP3260901.1 ABC transporter ATP-binding protein [Pseudobutyrivibrio sp.]
MADNKDLVLKIENVGKDYMLGAVTGDTLKDAVKLKLQSSKRKQVDEASLHNRFFSALDDVSFTVSRGECVGIIGSNGAGKSTLLKLISRITTPTRGHISINGKVASMLEVGTGFHPELTGRENIYLNGSILGMKQSEIDEKIDSIIEFSECQDFIDTPVKRYSSGMYVKLAFSVAAHLDADIMIMDEVLAVGDIKFQHKCLNKMKEIAKNEGRTVLYVSHNMDTVSTLCDRCLVLNHGRLVFDGAVDEAIRLYNGAEVKTNTTADFAKYIRPGWLQRDDIRLTWAEYVDYENEEVTGDSLEISFKYKCNKETSNVGIRVELMDERVERPFATQAFYNIAQGNAGDIGEFSVCVDLSKIVNGNYKTFYTLFVLSPYDDGIDLDCVSGLEIKINRPHKEGDLKWRQNSWGNVKL